MCGPRRRPANCRSANPRGLLNFASPAATAALADQPHGCPLTGTMSIISRYIFVELAKVFAVTLFGLTLLLVIVVVGQEAMQMNLGLVPTLRLIPFVLPTALVFAVPGTMLFTVCMIFGRMSGDNEVVAAKSAGISPMVLLRPAFVLAFIVSLIAVWLNDVAYSWGQQGMQRVVIESVEEICYGMLRAQRSYSNPRFSIIVKDVQDRTLVRPIINFQASNDMPALTLIAKEAELSSNLDKGTLRLILTDCEIDAGNGILGHFPGTIEREIPLTLALTKDVGTGSPTTYPMRQIQSEVARQEKLIVDLEQAMAAEVGFSLITGQFDGLHAPQWEHRRRHLSRSQVRLYRLKTEPWRRWANGFSCLCFVLVGAPLAIRMRTADLMTTFGLVFLPILLVYYPFLAYGLDRAKAGELPPYTVWCANILCVAIGYYLIRKVVRY
jgi:lipopolysaccharide export system permease protein